MKILLAEDDPICEDVLTTHLHAWSYETVTFPDGPSALAALLAPDAPVIAILDWMMPGLSGPEVCARLRSANLKARPYIIMHSSRADKADIAAGLEAGADDYLPKPVDVDELQARLHVAERTIRYQREQNKRIEELEALAQRYNLLGEIVARGGSQAALIETAFTPEGVAVANLEQQPAQPPVVLGDSEIQAVEAIVVQTLLELGLGRTKAEPSKKDGPYRGTPLMAWAGLILAEEQVWIDLLLEANPQVATKICEKSLHRPPRNNSELTGVLAETQTIISTAFKTSIQAKRKTVLSPLLSRARAIQPSDDPVPVDTNHRSYVFSFGDLSVGLTVATSSCAIRRKKAEHLRPLEVVAEPILLPQFPDTPIFNPGVGLNEHYIERLTRMEPSGGGSLTISVFEPSCLGMYFHR